ncbi:MAG: glycosyltransferase family 9 protein [Candidatus Caenarcaniphilales bacterium]|nr:glycosyltransferase family 9 protein [Candidatus Caenarcaniphilales bacterium]
MSDLSKALFIHSGGLGDVIMLSPSLRLLREKLGTKFQIDLLVEKRACEGSREFFALTDCVDEVKSFDFKGKESVAFKFLSLLKILDDYQILIASGSSPLVSVLLWCSRARRRIGFQSSCAFLLSDPVPLIRDRYASLMWGELISPLVGEIPTDLKPALPRESYRQELPENITKAYILVHPGVSQLSLQKGIIKSPNLAFWSDLLKGLCTENHDKQIVLVGGSDEKNFFEDLRPSLSQLPNLVDLSERRFSISALANLIAESKNFICVDSAPMHLGVAVNAQLEVIFTATDPRKLIPKDYPKIKLHKVDNLLCQPCLWDRRSKSCAKPLCVEFLNPQTFFD